MSLQAVSPDGSFFVTGGKKGAMHMYQIPDQGQDSASATAAMPLVHFHASLAYAEKKPTSRLLLAVCSICEEHCRHCLLQYCYETPANVANRDLSPPRLHMDIEICRYVIDSALDSNWGGRQLTLLAVTFYQPSYIAHHCYDLPVGTCLVACPVSDAQSAHTTSAILHMQVSNVYM